MNAAGMGFGYAYDGYNRPTGVGTSFGHIAGWTYWDNDALKYQAVTNAVPNAPAVSIHLTTYNANGLGQLASLVNQQGSVASPGAVLSQFDNTLYDGAGNLTQVVRQVAAASASPYSDTLQFQYNAKDELTQEKFLNNGGSPFVYNFAFDNAGNPTTFRGSARTYNANNQLTGPSSYAYDGNGNPTTYRGGSLTYDAGDNPTSISLGTGITAGYTSEGVRAWKQAGTVRTYFLYDGTDPVVEMNASGGTVAVNTFGVAGLVSRHYPSMFGANNSVFYTFDETGNVSQRFDGVGTLLSTHGFQAYGQYGSTSANPDPWGYKAQSGYYTDQETGLVLCTFRYYDPANGRWINRDPIGYAGGLNLYGYCGANPVNLVDPSGLFGVVVQNGNKVSITVPIFLHGLEISDAMKDELKCAVEQAWTGQFGKYDVTTKVVFTKRYGSLTTSTNAKIAPNSVKLQDNPDMTSSADNWDVGASETSVYNGLMRWNRRVIASHESGHLMGLVDEHNRGENGGPTTFKPGDSIPAGYKVGDKIPGIMNIMTDPVQERYIDRILQAHREKGLMK